MSLTRRHFFRLLAGAVAMLGLRPRAAAASMALSYPVSDHFDGRRFFNPGGGDPRGFRSFLRWQFTRRPGAWPERVENTARPQLPTTLAPGTCAVTWVGHATFLLQFPGLNVLTDPIWSERCSPVSWAGPRRVRAPGLDFAALPRIDLVLVSHNHYDHLDLPTLRQLQAAHRPLVVAPLGNRAPLEAEGLDRVVELDWWQEHAVRDDVRVTLTPAQHFAARGMHDRMRTLWGGFALATPAGRAWFAGDTGYFDGFREIGSRLGPFDLALVPIGAYEPRWFMEPVHCDPAEAIRIHRDVRARRSLAMHFECFPLADDAFDQPRREFLAARTAAGIPADEFALPEVGETRVYELG